MTFDDFKILAMGLKTVYGNENFLPDANAIKIWYKLLGDLPYEVLNVAIQKYMLTEKFPPTIAELRKISTESMQGVNGDWGEAWEQVRKAIKKYGVYNTEGALDSMDDVTRECVKRLGFTELCLSENQNVDRANFRMIYEEISKRKKEQMQLPIALQDKIKNLFGIEPKRLEEVK